MKKSSSYILVDSFPFARFVCYLNFEFCTGALSRAMVEKKVGAKHTLDAWGFHFAQKMTS
jgi:hypothetical protein